MYRFILIFYIILAVSCVSKVTIQNGLLQYKINHYMQTKVVSTVAPKHPFMQNYANSEYLETDKFKAQLFDIQRIKILLIHDARGTGKKCTIVGVCQQQGSSIVKKLQLSAYDSFPGMILTKVIYINTGKRSLFIKNWINNQYEINGNRENTPLFWSFQGSSSLK